MKTRYTRFIQLWRKYFKNAELPVVFYYTDHPEDVSFDAKGAASRCFVADLAKVRKNGKSLVFSCDTVGCTGGQRYLGFTPTISETLNYFLSCGMEGQWEGERYFKTPEMAEEWLDKKEKYEAGGKYLVAKRWDTLDEKDSPEIVVFFCQPDVMAGLFTLIRFDRVEQNAVIAPFGAGCSTIIEQPYLERLHGTHRAVIGLFDPSARPYIPSITMSFSVTIETLDRMIQNMDVSFLITPTWDKIRNRIP